MSGGGSQSSSKSNTTTTTSSTTQQQDQRVAATDAAVAIGPNASNINISQYPQETGAIIQGFLDLSQMAIGAAQAAGAVAVDTQTQLNEAQAATVETAGNNQRVILIGLAIVAALYLMKGQL